ncbi:V-type H+-transporting ATPase subunit a [Nematocida homosporus]|uniref:V-type H+-transporting ATPase subunit a n=1 Tax=Nematocida homosporus TaxID=1912981 RepID=UPI0022211D67|nr:V-type H+-transporting ATPase subunit a [Nematocida homosporus]KAI5187850.1 V-type H+-transporting ATPase subunit a [Nematocida homosporus]
MLRSEDISMVRIYISPDISRSALEELGHRNILHLVPMSDKKSTKSDYRLEMERTLSRVEFLLQELKKQEIPRTKEVEYPPLISTVDVLSQEVEKHYYRVVQLLQIMKETQQTVERQEEDVVVLQELQRVIDESGKGIDENGKSSDFELDSGIKFGLEYVAGVIKKGQIRSLEKFLWRSLHGNLYFIPIEMVSLEKAGFICFTHGERAIERVRTICTKIDARIVRYEAKKGGKKEEDLLQVSSNLAQVSRVHEINQETFVTEMKTIAREVSAWKYYVIREIEIEAAREKLETNKENSYLTGQGFILKRDEERFGRTIKKICEVHGDVAAEIVPIPKEMTKPTHFESNRITQTFQDLTNVYGIPAYKEINPTIFSVATFPFIFGCMFGDIGHGLILIAIALYMIRKEKVLNVPKSLEIIFAGRYLIALMGVWAVYFGFLYGDFIGYPIGESASAYKGGAKGVCYFGIDYAWHHSPNGSNFVNSLKMKTSLVIGFVHLTMGMVLAGFNARYRRDYIRLVGVVIPQLVIFFCLIGYMIFLIFLKWATPRDSWPGIIGIIIEMVSFAQVPAESLVYPGQNFVQKLLMSTVLLTIPWLLFFTPIYKIATKSAPEGESRLDMWMHTLIEGVEFLMGLISNISSYLRLWAVSLAHGELSAIIFTRTLGTPNVSLLFRTLVLFPGWAIVTFVLLICLEGLSSTLHSLRLHWVEFGSKFYAGNGQLFTPFTFKPQILLDPERKPGL